jgi:hypothetical protein
MSIRNVPYSSGWINESGNLPVGHQEAEQVNAYLSFRLNKLVEDLQETESMLKQKNSAIEREIRAHLFCNRFPNWSFVSLIYSFRTILEDWLKEKDKYHTYLNCLSAVMDLRSSSAHIRILSYDLKVVKGVLLHESAGLRKNMRELRGCIQKISFPSNPVMPSKGIPAKIYEFIFILEKYERLKEELFSCNPVFGRMALSPIAYQSKPGIDDSSTSKNKE